MKLTNRRIEVTLSRTINLSNHEFYKPQVGLTVDVPDDEDLQEAYDVVYSIVSEQLNKMNMG
jgi:hypothetical protein